MLAGLVFKIAIAEERSEYAHKSNDYDSNG
jgi:hypothetical protein